MIDVLFVGLGPLGQRILEDGRRRNVVHVAGAVDTSPELAGTRFGGVTVMSELARAIDATSCSAAVVATSSSFQACLPTFEALLDRGISVVSTCEELVYPWLRHEAAAARLDALCHRGGGRLLGTGINPGFLMDTLPIVASAVCHRIDAVRIARIQDASTRRVPFQAKIGAMLDVATFEDRASAGLIRHVGLGESMHLIAAAMDLNVTEWNETIEPVLAETDMECAFGIIPRGAVAGVRQEAFGHTAEGTTLAFEFVAAIGQADPHDEVEIAGEPDLTLRIPGGVHGDIATSAVVLAALPCLLEAAPGLHTMATIPPVRFRHGPSA